MVSLRKIQRLFLCVLCTLCVLCVLCAAPGCGYALAGRGSFLPDYIRTIRGPIRDVQMLAGGPVALDMIEPYLDAGCIAVNLGASLAVPDLVRTAQWEEIGRRALLATSIIQSRRDVVEPETYVH